MKKFSVITVNYNDAEGLDQTIRSITGQTFRNFEYIVIDGGSDDGSVEVIKKYEGKIDYWITEKDNGIYNAMNKGIAKAAGEYCLFINSGDFLNNNEVLEKVAQYGFNEDILYGDMMIDWGNGKITRGNMPDKITFLQMITDTLWHPVSFIRKKLFDTYGCYNEKNRIVSDYEFFLKTIILNNVPARHIPLVISVFNTRGLSSKADYARLVEEERKAAQQKYFPKLVLEAMQELAALKTSHSLWTKIKQKILHGR